MPVERTIRNLLCKRAKASYEAAIDGERKRVKERERPERYVTSPIWIWYEKKEKEAIFAS